MLPPVKIVHIHSCVSLFFSDQADSTVTEERCPQYPFEIPLPLRHVLHWHHL